MRSVRLALCAATAFVIAACPNQKGAFALSEISGTVTAGAPVVGATLSVFPVNEAGELGEKLALVTDTRTDENGAFAVEVAQGELGGPARLVVCATSGSFVEASTSTVVQIDDPWCARTETTKIGGDASVIITPWTTIHSALVECMVGRGDNANESPTTAAVLLNGFLGAEGRIASFDARVGAPLNLTTTTATGLNADSWHGVLLAGLAETAKQIAVASNLEPGLRVTSASLLAELVRDVNDGAACQFDGQGKNGRLRVGNIDLSADTLRGAPQGFASSILRFLESERNVSTLPAGDVTDIAGVLSVHRSALFGQRGAEGEGDTDLDKPVITYVSPNAGSTRGGVVRVEVTVTDASGLPTVAFIAPAQATFTSSTPTCTTDEEDGTSCTLVGNLNTSLAPVVDGPVVVSVRAVDAAGNTQTGELNFTANNSLPTIQVTSPQVGQPLQGVVTVSATAVDADGIETLSAEIPGVGICSSEPGAALVDVEPATGILTCNWNTALSPEGDVRLMFRAGDAAGQQAEAPHTVIVDNVEVSSLAGFIDVGSPVANARVVALDWSGRVRGAVIAETTSDETGAYSLLLDDTQRASILVVASAGTYVDPASGLQLTMGTGQDLTAAVAQLDAGEDGRLNLNAWTTLAAARAVHTPVTTDDSFAITSNNTLLSRHLRRAPGAVFDVSQTRSADLALVITVANERAVLALSHAGLSRLAAEISIAAGVAVGTVTMTELVKALADDLRGDPLLDGKQGAAPITVGPASQALTSFTTRFDLAAALDRFVVEAPLPVVNVDRNGTGITRADALGSLLYEHLAEDASPDLYPEDELPRPFDTSAPTIALTFSDANIGRLFGASLSGSVTIDGLATDPESSVVDAFATLDGVDPLPDANNTPERLRLAIGTEIGPNVVPAIQACAEAAQIDDAAGLGDGVCICALAEDENDNVGEALLCFTRPEPVITIAQPAPGTVINATASTALTTTVASGFNLASCSVSLSHTTATAPTLNAPSRVGPTCSFAQSLAPAALADGTWTFATTARDIADRSVTLARSFVVDTTPPTVTVTSPALGSVSNRTAFTMTGTVSGTGDLESIRVTEASFGTDITVPLAPNASTWSVPIDNSGNLIGDGAFNFAITARDVNGNLRQIAHSYVVDTSAPSLSFAPSQPDVVNYAGDQPVQPTGTLSCPATGVCIDKRTMAIAAAAERIPHASIFGSESARIITRWENLLDSTTDVPQVRVTASDSNGARVRFAIASSCTATPTSAAVPVSASEFRIDLRSSNTGINLASQTGAASLCLVIEAIDTAGNVSTRITKNFRWKTIAPPLPITMAPTSFSTDRVYPGGVPDASRAFKGTNLGLWARATVGQYGVLHGFIHNPYGVPVRAAVSFTGGSTMSMKIDMRLREVWTTGATPPRATENPLGQNDGGVLRNPCNNQGKSTAAGLPRPIWDDTPGMCGLTSQTGTLFRLTSWSGSSPSTTVVTGAATRTQRDAARPSTKPDVPRTIVPTQSVALAPNVLFYVVDGVGTPLNQTTLDAQGVLTLAPNTSVLWVITGSNATLAPNNTFHVTRDTIDTAATNMFFGAPVQNPTLPQVRISNTVFTDRVNVLQTKPEVLIWATNITGGNATDDMACDNNECAIGLRWTQVDQMKAERTSTSQRIVLRTRLGNTTEQDTTWATGSAFPVTARTVSAPLSPVP